MMKDIEDTENNSNAFTYAESPDLKIKNKAKAPHT